MLKSHTYSKKYPVVGVFAVGQQMICTRASMEVDQDPPFQAISVWFSPHQSSTDSFHTSPNEPH